MSRSCKRRTAARAAWAASALAILLAACPAAAWVEAPDYLDDARGDPRGVHVLDGSFVMNVGELQIHITNHGLIGSRYSVVSTFSDAPSAQWPAGSGVEYLWSAGLWVGGILLGERLVSTGQFAREFRPRDDIRDTMYEAVGGRLLRPAGNDDAKGARAPEPGNDDDEDGRVDEETLNGYDDDEDGLIDEDFGQIGNQMMVATMYDNTRLASELYPDHTPLNLQVVQQTYAWENDDVDDFVGFEFFIKNIGVTPIEDVYIGFFADCDIGARGREGASEDDMAGYWEGMVRTQDGSYEFVSIGYMYDNDGDDGQAPGYFGICFLGHDTDPTGQTAPTRVAIRSYQSFSGQQSFDQGGDPTNDAERYELLSSNNKDGDTGVGKQNDFRFMISGGPFVKLEPDAVLRFQAAMVCGNGLGGLRANAAEAVRTYRGNFFDFKKLYAAGSDVDLSGRYGRETRVCQENYPTPPGGENPIFTFRPDFMDTSCVVQESLVNEPALRAQDLFLITDLSDPDFGKHCIYVNMDNCAECARQNGQVCQRAEANSLRNQWNCWNPDVAEDQKVGCTGVNGNETQINWLVGMAPPPPGMRLWPTDNTVHVYWDDRSEHARDLRTNQIDFESYRIWRADNWARPFGSSLENGPESNLWQMIAEFDLENYFYRRREIPSTGAVVVDTLPLGRNTGLDVVRYTPACLADTLPGGPLEGLPAAMREVVLADVNGLYQFRPALRDRDGNPVPGLEGLLPWEGYPAQMDTVFAITERARITNEVPKRAVKYYEYEDRDVHNGFIYFYSVTASDHAIRRRTGVPQEIWDVTGAGQAGDPGSSFTNTVPAATAQSAEDRARRGPNIYVYPNPATREAVAEFQQLSPNADDPTGVRVAFANLPRARNTIKIYTEDGDLVQTLLHDGTSGYGQATWNLVSRNGQEIVSGIYLYTVHSDDDRFEDFIGKFVVVR